ncbi:protein tyrosine phosphatase (PTP) superfamily phosphohydrolase (DUF442 family) [Novosphingobium fluoreni]|uniref:Protein tyrosine phosphatase (PTP) superfamily phosphohydrolase (DUF442 family) n=1 Tax=Novosphingobium fluoreni TaxID=1391222 RepID=A0A7W6FXU9_9SPHN|nr:protein tyrosine phosphatase (PTP) superfamily phosphohydrolase (DUF442 family) [Novosphingobium fluoreni]
MDTIINYIAITDRLGTAGQPTEAQFLKLCGDGLEVVINLAPDGLETSLPDEGALLSGLGVEYHHIPVPWNAPSVAQYRRFQDAMASAAGKRTLVHCQANYRVTAFIAPYAQAHLGWTRVEAEALLAQIWNSRPDFAMGEDWREFIAQARQAEGLPA